MSLRLSSVAFFLALQIYASHQASYFAQNEFRDIRGAMVAVTDKVHNEGCVVVLIYDDLMPSISASSRLMMELQKDERMFITINLSVEQLPELYDLFQTNDTSEIISKNLHQLYRMNRCYTFLIWLTDPRVLYPENTHLHPGWRYEDVLVFTAHHITKRYKQLIELRFWKEIPNIVGLKQRVSRKRSINIFTVLPYFNNGQRKSHEIDVWLVKEKVFEKNATLIWDKFTSFNGAELNITVLWKAPFLIIGDTENPYFDGLDWRLLMLIHRSLKQRADYSHLASGETGNFRNGSWTGILGEIESGAADMGIGGISVNPARLADFGFCRTYYTDSYSFISPLNTTQKNAWSVFAKPLSPIVWMMLGITAIVVSVSVKIIALLERYLVTQLRRKSAFMDSWFTSVSNNLMHFLIIFCQRSFKHVPASNALKWVYIGTSIPITILGIVFSGCLFGQLLQPNPDVSIDRIEDVVNSKLEVDIRNYDGHLNDFVSKSGNEKLLRIWEKASLVNLNGSTASIDEVVKGNRIYIDSKARLSFTGRYKYKGIEGFKFHLSSDDIIKSVNVAWPTRKNWPFKPKIDRIIAAAVESGLVRYWMGHFERGQFGFGDEAYKFHDTQHLTERDRRTKDIDPTLDFATAAQVKPIKMEQLDGVVLLWMVGLILSILTFGVELAIGCSCLTARILHRVICWVNRKIQIRIDYRQELWTIQKELVGSTEIDSKTQSIPKPKRRRIRKHFVNGKKQSLEQFQEITWSDFDNTRRWASTVTIPGLVSSKNYAKQ